MAAELGTRQIKVVMACSANAGGEPDFFFVKVQVTHDDYSNGLHYEGAKVYAEDQGYEGPCVFFDENEAPAWLLERFVWESASLVDIKGEELSRSTKSDDEQSEVKLAYIVMQQGGSSGEWYSQCYDSPEEAQEGINDNDRHTYSSIGPYPIPDTMVTGDVMELLQEVASDACLEDFAEVTSNEDDDDDDDDDEDDSDDDFENDPAGLFEQDSEDDGPWSVMYSHEGKIILSGQLADQDSATQHAKGLQATGHFDIRDQYVYLLGGVRHRQIQLSNADLGVAGPLPPPPLDNIENEDDLP